jgi:glycosyltransferase involved in cell wall biosynthesis
MVQGPSVMRIAFWFDAPVAYSGGLNYIGNLLHALSAVDRSGLQPYVFFATDVPQAVIERFESHATVVRTPILERKTLPWLVHKLLYKIFGSMAMVNALLKRHGIELLSHAWTPYLGKRPIKVISWIPDFQYLHLPAMFPNLDADKESRINRRIATHADAVVVSSEHALGDLLSLVPREQLPTLEVLRFVSQPFTARHRPLPELAQLEDKYKFTGKFFLLPNQFWAHKNHDVVLRALAQAKQEGLSMLVLMTGNTKDYRLSGTPYVDGLNAFVREHGIENEARILGMIDYEDLLALMRHCVGVINPSRFEGWSSSVEEAKSIGKPVLMSRIPVHVEQAPEHGAYFDCDDAAELKTLMHELWNAHESVDQQARAEAARADLARRTQEFGRRYVNLIQRVAAQP